MLASSGVGAVSRFRGGKPRPIANRRCANSTVGSLRVYGRVSPVFVPTERLKSLALQFLEHFLVFRLFAEAGLHSDPAPRSTRFSERSDPISRNP